MNRTIKNTLAAALLGALSACDYLQPDYLTMISPADLNKILQQQDVFLVDVHVPQQRHIKGTDLFMPYDQVEQYIAKLPSDKNTVIYLYCESGRMGKAAARTLHDLGYTHLVNLQGGTHAWQKAGFAFE